MNEAIKRLTAIVIGRVQGVSFRYYTRREAKTLGLGGWVANQRDGTVIVVAEGPEQQLTRLINFLRRGSPAAYVENVDIDWSTAQANFKDFQIRWV
jgi:acylphosphatase